MFNSLILSTALVLSPAAAGERAALTPEEMFAEMQAGVLALDDGEAIFDYLMCASDRRVRSAHPYLLYQSAESLYPQYADFVAQDDARIYRDISYEEAQALEALIAAEVDARMSVEACQIKLVPNPEYLDRLADQARYMRAAIRGEVNPAEDYRDLMDQQLNIMASQPNGDQVLAIQACYAFTPFADQPRWGVDLARLGVDADQLEAELDRLGTQVNQFLMADRLFDEAAIWQEAISARIAVPSPEACQTLFSDYANPNSRFAQ